MRPERHDLDRGLMDAVDHVVLDPLPSRRADYENVPEFDSGPRYSSRTRARVATCLKVVRRSKYAFIDADGSPVDKLQEHLVDVLRLASRLRVPEARRNAERAMGTEDVERDSQKLSRLSTITVPNKRRANLAARPDQGVPVPRK